MTPRAQSRDLSCLVAYIGALSLIVGLTGIVGCGGGGGSAPLGGGDMRFAQPATPMVPANLAVGPASNVTVPDDQPALPTSSAAVAEQYSSALAINNSGEASGDFHTSDGYNRAFLLSGGAFSDVGALGGKYAFGLAVSDGGVVVGCATNSSGRLLAFSYVGGAISQLTTPDGLMSRADGINNNGVIAGSLLDSQGIRTPVYWQSNSIHTLPTPPGSDRGAATAINSFGKVVGEVHATGSARLRAAMWENGVYRDLGLLPGGTTSFARQINDDGFVIGFGDTAASPAHAFLWSSSAGMVDLGTLGGPTSAAFDINNRGVIVGTSMTASGARHAFAYVNGQMRDLNDMGIAGPGWVLEVAASINDRGDIVGWGKFNGVQRAFVLRAQ